MSMKRRMAMKGSAKIDQLDLDVVLTDLMMPGADGLAVLKHVREMSPQTMVVIMTAHASVETAIEAIRAGAQDYMLKPLVFADVLRKIQNLMSHRQLAWENQLLRREVSGHFAPDRPLGRSPAMQEIVKMIMKVAPTPTTVLISGESGVGKEVVARTIHANSPAQRQCLSAGELQRDPGEFIGEPALRPYERLVYRGGQFSRRFVPARPRRDDFSR